MRAPIPLPRTARPGGYPSAPNDPWAMIRKGLGNNSNALIGFGSQLMSNPNFSQALGAAGQGWQQGHMADAEQQQALAEQQQAEAEKTTTQKWIEANYPQFAGLPAAEGFQAAMKEMAGGGVNPTSDIQNYEYSQAHPGFEDFRKGGNQNIRAGVGPAIYGRNKTTGAVEPWQLQTDGSMINPANPNANPAEYDFDPGIAAGARTEGTVDAKTAGAARAALPGAQQTVDIANKAASALLNDTAGMQEQFGKTLGVIPNQVLPDTWPFTQPGSPMARFRTELAQGGGQAFMQARQMLRGGGQITDFEGAKAESAFSRMQLAAQNNNQEEFMQAVRDFQEAVNSGYQKLLAAANGGYQEGAPAVTGQSGAPQGGGYTVLGVE